MQAHTYNLTSWRLTLFSFEGVEFGVLNPIKDVNLSSVETNLKLILSKLPVPNSDIVAEVMKGWLENLVQIKLDNIRVWFNNKGNTVSYDEIKQKVITQANDYHRVKAYTP